MKTKKPSKNKNEFSCSGHSHQVENLLEGAYQSLKKAKLKRTPHRESLLHFLIENHGPFSKEEIQTALSSETIDGVTLYRNLASLEEIGLLRRSEFGDGVSRYEFQASTHHHHHHVICTACRKVESLELCGLDQLESQIKDLGYSQIRHSLEFFGICKSCEKKKNRL